MYTLFHNAFPFKGGANLIILSKFTIHLTLKKQQMESSPKLGAYNYRFGAIAGGIGIVFSMMLFFMDMTYDQSSVIQAIQTLDTCIRSSNSHHNFQKRQQWTSGT